MRDVRLPMPGSELQIWDTPNPVALREYNTFRDCTRLPNTPYGLKHVALESISGITICFCAGAIASIHSHTDVKSRTVESDLPSLNEQGPRNLVYMFLPFQKSERISRILVRQNNDKQRAAALVVSRITNRFRSPTKF